MMRILKPFKMNRFFIIVCFFFSSSLLAQAQKANSDIWVREGYKLEVVENSISTPRFMQMDDQGVLYVSLPGKGEIKACKDKNNDGFFETITTFTKNHTRVHGMHFAAGWLWFAKDGAILKARDNNGDGVADEEIEVINKDQIPSGGGHWWRPVLIHNNRIYTAIGCSGNITEEVDSERLKIWSFAIDGTDKQQYCDGLRNTEKLVVRPGTNEIWGMDHGSDWFGRKIEEKYDKGQPTTDWNPAGEMNFYQKGKFYGHPYIVGNKIPRYEYMYKSDIIDWANKTEPPAWSTGAHLAPNAMTFYNGKQFPNEIKGDAFVAFHGSWNRSEKGGYQVARVLFEEGKPYGQLPLVKFLSPNGDVIGRPVDILVEPSGSVLISDDFGDKIYRLTYVGN